MEGALTVEFLVFLLQFLPFAGVEMETLVEAVKIELAEKAVDVDEREIVVLPRLQHPRLQIVAPHGEGVEQRQCLPVVVETQAVGGEDALHVGFRGTVGRFFRATAYFSERTEFEEGVEIVAAERYRCFGGYDLKHFQLVAVLNQVAAVASECRSHGAQRLYGSIREIFHRRVGPIALLAHPEERQSEIVERL